MRTVMSGPVLGGLCGLFTLTLASAVSAQTPAASIPRFPTQLSSELPYDVDIDALRRLSLTPNKPAPPYDIGGDNLPAAQRLFDLFSWQSFIALNWPAASNGQPDKGKTIADSTALRVWEYYIDSTLVYQQDGAAPPVMAQAVKSSQQRVFSMSGMALGTPAADAKKGGGFRRPLFLNESLQAFTGPMVDQAGHWVRYQVVLNPVEFDYLVSNKLYNLEGQAAFSASRRIEFPTNTGTRTYGSMEVKTSWKQLTANDDAARFFVRRAKVLRLDGTTFDADFGMVGMHLAVRTQSSPTWIWATFEQVDNTAVNDLERDSKGRPLQPSFFDPALPAKPVNVLAPKNSMPVKQYDPATGQDTGPAVFTSWDEAKTTVPTQTLMVLPVPKATAALNREVQAVLAQASSVFKNYELIGTQWPAQPEFPAFPNGVAIQSDGRVLPASMESILFKVPGKLVPTFLVNTTMETFFQNGNQVAGPVAADDRLPPGEVADPSTIFATESCAGCHFSAGACIGFKRDPSGRYVVETLNGKKYRVPIFGQNASRGVTGNADYSWLMQIRAQSAPYAGTDTVPIDEVLIVP
jgi:hypothetical protein